MASSFLIKHPRLNPLKFSFSGTYRTITSSLRTFPDFIVVGFPKCGTKSLFSYVIQHPNIGIAARRGKYFFDVNYWRGIGWYKAHFPTVGEKNNLKKQNAGYCIGEYTARYMMYYPAAKRIKELIPDVKPIALLRNPTDGVYSQYHFKKSWGFEKMTFDEAVADNEKRLENWNYMVKNDLLRRENHAAVNTPYMSVRKYAKHLKEWFKYFPQENFLLLQTEKMSNESEIQDTVNKVFNFLGLSEHNIKDFTRKNVNKYKKMSSKTRDILIEYFKPYNAELEKMLNRKFNWDV